MEIEFPYNIIIACSLTVILSFLFGELSRKTNVPSVLMLIVLGIVLQPAMQHFGIGDFDFFPVLEILGIVGLIMIVLEAALELELRRDKMLAIGKALLIALITLIGSTWVAALILEYSVEGMTTIQSWLYATPLSILSSAVIIPSVSGLSSKKKEFHIYESTFSDILGIMLFYFLTGSLETSDHGSGTTGFIGSLGLTILLSVAASYILIFVFQNIRSHVKLFLLISVLLLLYSLGKGMHLSALIIILIFGLLIANMKVFFRGKLGQWLDFKKAEHVYEGLHVVTGETAFVVRTFFFVIFGLTITLSHLFYLNVALISGAILVSIYAIRFVVLRIFLGADIFPQLFIAPRGLITILLYYAIPQAAAVEGFEPGVLLFIIITTSLIMTVALISDKRRTGQAEKNAMGLPVGYSRWKAPSAKEQREAVAQAAVAEEGEAEDH